MFPLGALTETQHHTSGLFFCQVHQNLKHKKIVDYFKLEFLNTTTIKTYENRVYNVANTLI